MCAKCLWGVSRVSGINSSLVQALLTTGLVVALWALVAVPATLVKRTLSALGFAHFPVKAAEIAQRLGVFGASLTIFFDGLRESSRLVGEGASVELALNDRNKGLRAALKRAEHSIRVAAQKIAGLEGANGPKHLVGEIQALRQQTEAVKNIGADFDEDIADQYAGMAGAKLWLVALIIGGLFVFALNGSLLAQFFRELFPVRFLGVTIGQILAYAFVVVEIVLGVCLGLALSKLTGFGKIAGVGVALVIGAALALVEFVAFSALSANIDPEFYVSVDLPHNWLGPLGIAMVLLNTLCGYFIHYLADQIARHSGAKKLQRELRAASEFSRTLPQHWEAIDAKARAAENSVQRYVSELGGQSDRMSGLVDNMARERDTVIVALRDVQLDDTVLAGSQGDMSRATARAVGMFVLAVVWTSGFVLGFSFLLIAAFGAAVPWYAAFGLSLLVAGGGAALGQVAYGRVQRLSGDRLQPLATNAVSWAVVGICLTAALVGICWLCGVIAGGWGVLAGVLLTALCVPFTVVGYHLPETAKGGMLVATVLARFFVATVAGLLAVSRYLLIWVAVATAWLLNAILAILAAPVEMLITAISRARRQNVAAPQSTPVGGA